MWTEISLLEFHSQCVWSQNLNVSRGRSLHFSCSEHGNEPDASGHEVEAWINRAQHMGLNWYLREDVRWSPSRKRNHRGREGRCRGMGEGGGQEMSHHYPHPLLPFRLQIFFSWGYSQPFCFCLCVLFYFFWALGYMQSSLLPGLVWWGGGCD